MDDKIEMLHKLCKALTEELEDYSRRIEKADRMSPGDLEAIDTLSHSLKSIKTTIAMMEAGDEGGYSGRYMPPRYGVSYADDGMTESYRGDRSYARGRNARRDSMGRYSRESGYSYAAELDGVMADLENMMGGMPADKQRRVQQLMDELRR